MIHRRWRTPRASPLKRIYINKIDPYYFIGNRIRHYIVPLIENRLNALRNMLNQASYLINEGDYEAACDQLGAALKRCDDFVEGTAAGDLKMMISELMNDLGC